MNYRDIYSQYPELATRFVRTSRQFNEISSIGNCNLDLSVRELENIIKINPYSRKALFQLNNPGTYNEPGVDLAVYVFMKMPLYDEKSKADIYLWSYDAIASLSEEQGNYHILTMHLTYGGDSVPKNFIKQKLNNLNGIQTLDVKNIFLLYNNRTSCTQPNYAKNKTMGIFNKMVEKLSPYDAIVMLNLYLMINCIILELNISKNFINCQKKFTLKGENEYNYNYYVEDTENDRYQMIIDIKTEINNF
jgi:hypothetical protein